MKFDGNSVLRYYKYDYMKYYLTGLNEGMGAKAL